MANRVIWDEFETALLNRFWLFFRRIVKNSVKLWRHLHLLY